MNQSKAVVGQRFPESQFTVSAARAEEYVIALGLDPEEGWSPVPGMPVPPGFLMYVSTYGAETVHDAIGLDFRHGVYGGMDVEYHAPVRIGDTLTVSPVISGVSTKDGKAGSLTFVELTCEYLLPGGRLAVRERSTTIQTGGPA